MKIIEESVTKLPKCCISNDCAQVMIPYFGSMTILSKDHVMYSSELSMNNEYMKDERKNQFPYSNIPTHNGLIGKNKVTYINQLFDYNTPYVIINNGKIFENFVLKNDNQIFLIQEKLFVTSRKTSIMTIDEISKFVNSDIYIIGINGKELPNNINTLIPDDKEIIKNKIINYVNTTINKLTRNRADEYLYILNDREKNYFSFMSYLNNLSLDDLVKLDFIMDDSYITLNDKKINNSLKLNVRGIFNNVLVAKLENEIKLELLEICYSGNDMYEVTINDIKTNNYDLNYINNFKSKISEYKYPKIDLSINENIKNEDIKSSKKLIKQLNK